MRCCPEVPGAKILDQETALARNTWSKKAEKRQSPSAQPSRDQKSPVFLLENTRPCCPATKRRTTLRKNAQRISRRVKIWMGWRERWPAKAKGRCVYVQFVFYIKAPAKGSEVGLGTLVVFSSSWRYHLLGQLHTGSI